MGIWQRVKALWELSGEIEQEPNRFFTKPKAEFIMPNRVEEIFSAKPGATLDDVIQK